VLAGWIKERFQVATVRACRLARFSRAGFYRKSMAKDQSALRLRIREIAHARPRFGYQHIHIMLRREGWPVNKKRVRRLYRLDGLQLRTRIRRRKHMCLHRGPVPVPSAPHERWSIDFVHDQLFDGRPFRILTVVDLLSRESPLIEVDFAMSGQRVANALEARTADMPAPVSITVDYCRSWIGVHLKSARGLGLATRCETRLHPTRKAHGKPAHRVV
jgi:putative transposase